MFSSPVSVLTLTPEGHDSLDWQQNHLLWPTLTVMTAARGKDTNGRPLSYQATALICKP